MTSTNDGGSPGPQPWSAADSDKCECVLRVLPHDVLLGRGSGPNDHVGNINFRDLVQDRKSEYLSTNHRQTKALIAKEIVDRVYERGGRFLKKLGAAESARMLPKLLAQNASDDSENDRANDLDSSGPCDVYQIQKHSTVMEKAKQALRQNQRSGSLSPPETPTKGPDPVTSRRDSLGNSDKFAPPESQPHGILLNANSNNMNNNNWGGMGMGNIDIPHIPTTLNNTNQGNHSGDRQQGGSFHNNNVSHNPGMDSFDRPNTSFSPSSHQGQNQDYQQKMYQQQQDLMNLQQQHDLLTMQYQQHQQQTEHQRFQTQQLEMEKHNQLLQEQLELQIRQEQLRQLQQQSLQKLASNASLYSKHEPPNDQQQPFLQPEHTPSQSQNAPPAVLNGYATYTTTLDAIEDCRQNSNDGLADPQEMVLKPTAVLSSNNGRGSDADSEGNETDVVKLHDKFDEKSMQMSTMMGSFKDMSVRLDDDHSMHGSGDTIGTIDNMPSGVGGLSMQHMSGISIMSMMNDSTDSLFKNQQKAGNVVGAKNSSWGNTNSQNPANLDSSQEPLADVMETVPNAAAIAIAAGLLQVSFPKATRRWSGGGMPETEVPIRRANRRGSLQCTSSNNNEMSQRNTMATATAMMAMHQQQQGQNYSSNGHGVMAYGGHEMMNPSNPEYLMENSGFTSAGGSSMAFHNN